MCPVVNPNYEERAPLPPGIYKARIIGCEFKTSKKGSDYLNWKFETITQNPATDRQWIYMVTTYSGKGALLFRELVRAAKFPSYENGPINTDDLLGSIVTLHCEKGLNQDGTESPYLKVMEVHRGEEDSFDAFEEGEFGKI